MAEVRCVDCGAPIQVDEYALKRGAPVSHVSPGQCFSFLRARIDALIEERDEAREWVRRLARDTQTLTCVYCGKAYPPGSPTHGAQILTEHVKVCEKHPMRELVDLLNLAVRGCLDPGGRDAFREFVVALAEWRDREGVRPR